MKKITNRLDWDIFEKGRWVAVHNETGQLLFARTKPELMSKINKFELEFA